MNVKYRGPRKGEHGVFQDLQVANCGGSREQNAKSLLPSYSALVTP